MGIEVLLLTDRIDEWWTAHLPEYQGKALVNITRSNEFPELVDEQQKRATEEAAKTHEATLKRLAEALTGRVKAVRPSARLVESPACLVVDEGGMTLNLQRILQAAGQQTPTVTPVLEVNVDHPLFARLAAADDAALGEWAELLFDEALLAEGGTLADPAGFVKRVNRLLLGTS